MNKHVATPGRGRRGKNPYLSPEAEARLVRAHLDEGKSLEEAAHDVGLKSDMIARFAVAREQGRREAIADPPIHRSDLSKTARELLDRAIRQHTKKLDLQFEARIQVEYRRRFDQHFPDMQKRYAEAARSEAAYRDFLQQQKKFFTPDQFRTIVMCLHPDGERTPEKLHEAFLLFNARRFALTGEK